MAYFVKKDTKKNTAHLFSEGTCVCDGKEHLFFPVVCKGVQEKYITCKKCKKLIGGIVVKEVQTAMENLTQ